MVEMIQLSGIWGILISSLALLNVGLVAWLLPQVLGGVSGRERTLRNRINVVLFWGGVGALAGLLGQANGIYLASRAISAASQVSPQVVWEGIAISFLPTLMGLGFLLVSALVWMGLKTLHGRRWPMEIPA